MKFYFNLFANNKKECLDALNKRFPKSVRVLKLQGMQYEAREQYVNPILFFSFKFYFKLIQFIVLIKRLKYTMNYLKRMKPMLYVFVRIRIRK